MYIFDRNAKSISKLIELSTIRNKINKKYNVNFSEYFSKEIIKLKELERKGLLSYTDNLITVTTVGRYFVRHICRIFDKFLDDNSAYEVHGN